MTIPEYLKWAAGRRIDTDGVPSQPYQCADLIKDFLKKRWGYNFSFTLPERNPYGYARSIYENFNYYPLLRSKALKIKYTPGLVPQRGDIVVWGQEVGKAGHVAIATGTGDSTYFISLDQNWGKKYYVAETKHSYKGVIGIIRMRNFVNLVDLNARRGPGTGYEIAYTIKAGENLTVYEFRGNWARIDDNIWVSFKYLG